MIEEKLQNWWSEKWMKNCTYDLNFISTALYI